MSLEADVSLVKPLGVTLVERHLERNLPKMILDSGP